MVGIGRHKAVSRKVRRCRTVPILVVGWLAVWSACAVAAPPLMDLDTFDASRRHVALPNGMSLAYVDIGPRDAPVILLIHGYTSNARGWVPLLPCLLYTSPSP